MSAHQRHRISRPSAKALFTDLSNTSNKFYISCSVLFFYLQNVLSLGQLGGVRPIAELQKVLDRSGNSNIGAQSVLESA